MSNLISTHTTLPPELDSVRRRYSDIYTVVSPPRCCSTPFARVLWQHPSVAHYSHEPFEITYFRGAPLEDVAEKLHAPLSLAEIGCPAEAGASALAIKEMPYQVGDRFPELAALATAPVVFLMRDPRLSIASRMEKKVEVGDNPIFPLVETGWELLQQQIDYCRGHDISYLIVTARDFCDTPLQVFPEIFTRLGLEFSDEMITWQACRDLEIDNLEGDHSHLYWEVLGSSGLEHELDEVPSIDSFPTEGGFRDHVARALEIYDELSESPARVRPASS